MFNITVDPKQYIGCKRYAMQPRAGWLQGRGGYNNLELGNPCKIKDCKAEADTAA